MKRVKGKGELVLMAGGVGVECIDEGDCEGGSIGRNLKGVTCKGRDTEDSILGQ